MKRYYKVLVAAGVVLFLFLPIILIIRFQALGQIQFLPDRFAEEFWKFLANLVSIAFGFVLINIFWARKEQRDKIGYGKSIILNYLFRINRISSRIKEMLSVNYSETEFDKSKKRDDEVVSLSHRIQKLAESLENMTFDPLILNDANIKKVFVELIWEELLPNIDMLANQDNFRKDFDRFLNTISRITMCSDAGIQYLFDSESDKTK